MRDDERLFVGDAGMIVAAGATQKLVESFAAGDSILSPVTASDLDALPALFFSSGVWLLCWLGAQNPSKYIFGLLLRIFWDKCLKGL